MEFILIVILNVQMVNVGSMSGNTSIAMTRFANEDACRSAMGEVGRMFQAARVVGGDWRATCVPAGGKG